MKLETLVEELEDRVSYHIFADGVLSGDRSKLWKKR